MRMNKFGAVILSLFVAGSTSGTAFATQINQDTSPQINVSAAAVAAKSLEAVKLSGSTEVGDVSNEAPADKTESEGTTESTEGVQPNDEPKGDVVADGTQPTENNVNPEEPVVENPAGEEEIVPEEPKPETPAIEEPKVEEPAVETPATEEPKAEEPAVETPATEEPKAEEPAVETPVIEEPKAEEPAVETPVVEEPVVEEVVPIVEVPVVEEVPVAATLSILHVFEYGDVHCEDRETRDGLMTGDIVRFGDYTYEDAYEFAKCENAEEVAKLAEGENQIIIRYTLKNGYYIEEDEEGYYAEAE